MGARIYVEIDLLEPPLTNFPLLIGPNNKVWQEVIYEKWVDYCTKCFQQEHSTVVCKTRLEKNKLKGKTWMQKDRNKGALKSWMEVNQKDFHKEDIAATDQTEVKGRQGLLALENQADHDVNAHKVLENQNVCIQM